MVTTFEFDVKDTLPCETFVVKWHVMDDYRVIHEILKPTEIPIAIVANKDMLYIWMLCQMANVVPSRYSSFDVRVIVLRDNVEIGRTYFRREHDGS